MNTKRFFELTGIFLAVALIMFIMYRFVNTQLTEDVSIDMQAVVIFDEASCVACHQKNATFLFYTGIPFFGEKINKGFSRFDIGDNLDKLKKGEAINEVCLSKIEMATLFNHFMPPAYFYLTHWGASITPPKQTALKNWAKKHRTQFYSSNEVASRFQYDPVRPVPSSMAVDQQKAMLGKILFHDTRLSADNTISCASCHQPDNGGANHFQFATGAGKRLGTLNTPSLYNAYFQIAQSWDGHAVTLHEIIKEHITDALIMGNQSFAEVMDKLQSERQLGLVLGNNLTEDNITDAIAEFVKSRLTPDCRFDAYLKGDENAINHTEITGYTLFKLKKCAICHAGMTLGGQSFELMGIYKDYFHDRGWDILKEDRGRFNVTADEHDRHRFKVPGLRNVALTKPYFHDGSRQSLVDAVQIMGTYQSNQSLTDDETSSIVAFLETLTADPPLN